MPRTRAKLFMHGGSQAVRLPKEFRFEGSEVELSRSGDAVLTPVPQKQNLKALWKQIDELRGDEFLEYPPKWVFQDPPKFDE